ncbi:MAG: SRPBCC domain-containing protein [Planctomycetes bacterium]|nr:SRPBCC domain-containing protein [Planctomycetota bacterium]
MNARELPATCRSYGLEVPIAAPRDTVWAALVDETDAWWLPDFHMVASDSVLRLDARAGGALVEHQDDGGSLLWYTVQLVRPGEALHLVGHVAPEWGGPATSMLALTLEARGDKTVLHVRDSLFGHVTDEQAESLRDGWIQLFTEGLRRHVEG